MDKIMESHKLTMRTVIFICVISLCLIAAYIAWSFYFSTIWVEKKEFFGLKNGVTKQEALNLLVSIGVKEILPRPKVEIAIGKSNVTDINQLKNAPAICVVSYVDNIALKASFDESGNVTAMLNDSVKKFDELPEKKSINDFIFQLRSMIVHQVGLEAFACILESRWIIVEHAKDANAQTLQQYDGWMFDAPSNRASIKLKFEEGKLLKIESRKQIAE